MKRTWWEWWVSSFFSHPTFSFEVPLPLLLETPSSRIFHGPDQLIYKQIMDSHIFYREEKINRLVQRQSDAILSFVTMDVPKQIIVYPKALCDLHTFSALQKFRKGILFRGVLCQIIRGLYDLHRLGIEHYDIKPENILMFDNGTVRISDFGCAVHAASSYQKFWGTYPFMAPELCFLSFDGDYVPHSMDVYSTCVMIVYLLFPQLYIIRHRPLLLKEYRSLYQRATFLLRNRNVHSTLGLILIAGLTENPSFRISMPTFLEAMSRHLHHCSDVELSVPVVV